MEPANHLMPTNLDQIRYKKVPSMIESVVMRPLQRNPRYRIVIGYREWQPKKCGPPRLTHRRQFAVASSPRPNSGASISLCRRRSQGFGTREYRLGCPLVVFDALR